MSVACSASRPPGSWSAPAPRPTGFAAARPVAVVGEPKSEKPDATGALSTSAPPAAAVPGVPGQAVKPEAPTRAEGAQP